MDKRGTRVQVRGLNPLEKPSKPTRNGEVNFLDGCFRIAERLRVLLAHLRV